LRRLRNDLNGNDDLKDKDNLGNDLKTDLRDAGGGSGTLQTAKLHRLALIATICLQQLVAIFVSVRVPIRKSARCSRR
jgi:hypothetical protein